MKEQDETMQERLDKLNPDNEYTRRLRHAREQGYSLLHPTFSMWWEKAKHGSP